ncbi:MAG: GNAT family N-acetyltransferase [Acutalibacteraceae bacterium]
MNIINYFECDTQQILLEKLEAVDWSAAKFLVELLRENKFYSTLGGEGDLYLLMDGENLVSFLTLTRQDTVRDESMFPWVGFVYTMPEYRGNRYSEKLLTFAESEAIKKGFDKIYIATDHTGLYEKFGYEYLENRIGYWGDDNRVLWKKLNNENGRKIISMQDKYLQPSLDMIRKTFTDSESAEDAQIVVDITCEIRSMDFYVPELELIMVDEKDEVIGYAMFSKIHLGGKFQNELLILNPVAVKTEYQRQHISKELIEFGFEKAKSMGFKAVIVEGNPKNYQSRGFKTSVNFGITAGESIGLPAPECLMVKELCENACSTINGVLEYTDYKTLTSNKEEAMNIKTERLLITEFTLDMAEAVHLNSLDCDNRRFNPDEVFETVDEARETVEFLMSVYENGEGPLVYPILLNNNTYIGYVQAVPLEENTWEIGYHIGDAYTKKGYATEAVKAFLPVIMEKLNITEIMGVCLVENIASVKVLEKSGFIKEFEGKGNYQGNDREICKYVYRKL